MDDEDSYVRRANAKNTAAYVVLGVVLAGMFFFGLLLGFLVSPWWLLLLPAAVIVLRVTTGPI